MGLLKNVKGWLCEENLWSYSVGERVCIGGRAGTITSKHHEGIPEISLYFVYMVKFDDSGEIEEMHAEEISRGKRGAEHEEWREFVKEVREDAEKKKRKKEIKKALKQERKKSLSLEGKEIPRLEYHPEVKQICRLD